MMAASTPSPPLKQEVVPRGAGFSSYPSPLGSKALSGGSRQQGFSVQPGFTC